MDKLHATIHKASRSVRYDPHAKAGFRRTLEALTALPASAPAGFRLPRALAWALAAIIVASTGATATYASTRALPGEALYAVKVNVLEPAESAFALSADAKADVAVAHLERRFQEAAALSAAGTLDAYEEELAVRAEKDVAVVDREDQPVARARFEALASVYGPSLKLRDVATSRFAAAVRLGDGHDLVSDDVAEVTAREQLRVARERGDEAKDSGSGDIAVSSRLQKADRLSRAAHLDLDRGSYQAALKLSGAAAQAAIEAQLFAAFGTTTTSTAVTVSPATSTTVTSTSTATTSVKERSRSTSPQVRTPSGAGGALYNLLH